MLLAPTPASRPLHGAEHMGEPTTRSTSSLILPLPNLCPSVRKDEENGDDTATPTLRPRSGAAPQPTSEGDLLKHIRATPTLAPVNVASSVGSGGDETCSNDVPSKGISSLTSCTSHVRTAEANSTEAEVAVREEDEDNLQDEDNTSQSQRQSPSPSSSFKATSKPRLASALKNCSSPAASVKKGRNYRTRRRIRGIWGDDNDSRFSQLHDETMLLIMKYLSMKDLCIASMVCQRWKHVSLHQDSWKRIDATDFVRAAYDHYSKATSSEAVAVRSAAPKSTSLALAARMERNTPLVLEIHMIQHRLSADNFLSSLPSLQELTLTSFDDLTDTHIHVLLLSSSCKNVKARSNRSCILRKLVLEQCPRLTDTTVKSIGKLCPDLEELSLKGNPNITDLTPLKDLWHLVKKPTLISVPFTTRKAPPMSLSSMSLLFSGPPPPAAAAPAPSPPRPSTPTNSLQSLFALPGHSPPRASNVISVLPRTLSSGSNANEPGKLKRVNVSNTGVSSKTLLTAWKAIPPGNCVRLEKLLLGGTGETWSDTLLRELAENLDMPKLQSLNIGCSPTSTSRITVKGLQSLLMGKGSLRSLKQLDLSGHDSLSGTCLSEVLTVASTTLEELVLDGCKGLSSKTSNPAKDFASCDALAKAILNCTTRKIGDNQKEGGRGLRRLSLSRCFSNQSKLQRNNNLLMHEETLGNFLLEAMGPKPKTKKKSSSGPPSCIPTTTTVSTLQELDLSDCWFVTSADVAALRKRCPRLGSIHLKGTRADVAS